MDGGSGNIFFTSKRRYVVVTVVSFSNLNSR